MDSLEAFVAGLDGMAWRDWGITAAVAAGAVAAGLLVHSILFAVLHRLARRTAGFWDDQTVHHLAAPSRLLFPLLLAKLSVAGLKLGPATLDIVSHTMSLFFLASVSFLLVRLIGILRDFLLARYDVKAADNLAARKVHTQIRVLEKALLSVVAVATAAFMLMTFDGIRQVGVSILASAGIAGIIIGLAAQKSIGTLLAGLQIAVTQPIRIDDVVIVEGEWGWIEEITLTYVVVRIWDLRRLVVPINWFIDRPFQNWTRSSSEILGTVFLYVDYGIPLDSLRQELQRIVKTTPLWDGKACGLVVTDCKPAVLEIRLLVSAASGGDAWDLRCLLRERMVAFIQANYPEYLPRVRAELSSPGSSPAWDGPLKVKSASADGA
jgi:small-conductance mechanosensitive channel